MSSTLTKYLVIVVAVSLVGVVLLFGSNILTWLSQGGSQPSDKGQGAILTPTPTDKVLTEVHYCRDTKPYYTLGQEADRAVGQKIESFVNYDTGGMIFTASYIASSSYEDS